MINRISSNPTSLLFLSVLLGYVLFFMPWIKLDVLPIYDPEPMIIVEGQDFPESTVSEPEREILLAGVWTSPLIDGCSAISRLDWIKVEIENSYIAHRIFGWIMSGLMFILWGVSFVKNIRVKPVISRFIFVILIVLLCFIGIILLSAVTPYMSCPGLIIVEVYRVWLYWPSVLISLVGIVFAFLSIFTHEADESSDGASIQSAS